MSEPLPLRDAVLGVTTGELRLGRTAEIRDACQQLATQARREILVFEPRLEPLLYDQRRVIDAVRQLALARPVTAVRILVYDPRALSQRSHRLMELAQRLTSRIAIRRVADDDQDRLDAFVLVDGRGYLRRQSAVAMEALAEFNNPLETRRLQADFNALWERATTETELRRLHL